jgi:integrase/recombinase XerD
MTTLADHLDDFLRDLRSRARLKRSTVAAYRNDLHAAAAALPHPLSEVTPDDIAAFLDRGEASSTTARRMASLRRFFAWAVREELCPTNPLDQLDPVRPDRRLPRPIQADSERAQVDRAIRATGMPHRLVLLLLRETGMRVGEALYLNVGDVTLAAGREGLHIRDAKNHTERVVVLGPQATPRSLRGLRAYLRTLAGQPPHAPLFRSNRGTRLSYDALHYQWVRACAAAGLADEHGRPRYTLHQLRHTHATELLEQGQRIEIVQRVLGHRDPRSTQGYADLTERQVRAALEARHPADE